MKFFEGTVQRSISRLMGRLPRPKTIRTLENGKTIYVDMGHTNVAFAEGVAHVLTRKRAQHLRLNGFGKCGRIAFVRIRRSRFDVVACELQTQMPKRTATDEMTSAPAITHSAQVRRSAELGDPRQVIRRRSCVGSSWMAWCAMIVGPAFRVI